ncbi:MAG: DUF1572 family protein [Saprospiraceae bacterium]|nr:DUF1572 family protein [Saprospiraceae bacterium]
MQKPSTPITQIQGLVNQFRYYKSLGDNTLGRLTDTQLVWQYNTESNSIAIIVNHLWGNMLSRWTDFLNTDGEKLWRDRDTEFEVAEMSKVQILEKWEAGCKVVYDTLSSLTEVDLEKTIYIRNEAHSVHEAIYRQLAHYAYHVGQMVFLGKMLLNEQWTSLSIPRNGSQQFNRVKIKKW